MAQTHSKKPTDIGTNRTGSAALPNGVGIEDVSSTSNEDPP